MLIFGLVASKKPTVAAISGAAWDVGAGLSHRLDELSRWLFASRAATPGRGCLKLVLAPII